MSVSLCGSKQRHFSALLCTGPYLPPLLYSVVHMIHKIKTAFALSDSNARMVFVGSQRNSPCSSAVILSHAVPNCGWLIYWSATLLFFSCLLLLTGGSVAGASFIFWPFTCEFPQSSRSINNPLAHHQNSIPVLPPAQRAIVTESGCFVNAFKKKEKRKQPGRFLCSCLKLSFVEGAHFIQEDSSVWGHQPSAAALSTRSLGLRSPIRAWWLSPWDEKLAQIQSRVHTQETKSML